MAKNKINKILDLTLIQKFKIFESVKDLFIDLKNIKDINEKHIETCQKHKEIIINKMEKIMKYRNKSIYLHLRDLTYRIDWVISDLKNINDEELEEDVKLVQEDCKVLFKELSSI